MGKHTRLRLMTRLMPDVRGMHRTNTEYAGALEAQDRVILSKCTTQCSDKCIYHTIVKAIIPQYDNTGPVDLPTLLQRYRDSRLKEALRPLTPAHFLASDIQRLKVMCFSNLQMHRMRSSPRGCNTLHTETDEWTNSLTSEAFTRHTQTAREPWRLKTMPSNLRMCSTPCQCAFTGTSRRLLYPLECSPYA